MTSSGQYDASASLAGYLFQCRLALLLAIREMKVKPNCHVSIEKFDDIAFSEDDVAHCILQAKHHGTAKDLTDFGVDVWKTLRIWIEQAQAGTFVNVDTRRLLITTATAPEAGAMAKLRATSSKVERKLAYGLLAQAAKQSINKSSKIGREKFLALTQAEAELLLDTVTVVDRAPDLHDVFEEIVGELHIVSATSADKVAESLEGWWFGAVGKRLLSDEEPQIPVQHIAIKAQELAVLFGPKGLPVTDPEELGEKPYEPDDEDQLYVRQMRLIQLQDAAIKRGIQDFYRSNTQRSRWARENLLLDGEVAKYEGKLQDQWARRFDAECCDASSSDDQAKRSMGRKVYFWASQQQIDFRNVIETWITAGTFHSLADRRKIGWHPNFNEHFGEESEDGSP